MVEVYSLQITSIKAKGILWPQIIRRSHTKDPRATTSFNNSYLQAYTAKQFKNSTKITKKISLIQYSLKLKGLLLTPTSTRTYLMWANKHLQEAKTTCYRFTTKAWARASSNITFSLKYRPKIPSSRTPQLTTLMHLWATRKLSQRSHLSTALTCSMGRNRSHQNSKQAASSNTTRWPKRTIIWIKTCCPSSHKRRGETKRGTFSQRSLISKTYSSPTCRATQQTKNQMRMTP